VIVCPLAAGPILPCCGPPVAHVRAAPQAICCPVTAIEPICCPVTTIACLRRVTIASAPNPSAAGAPVTISGRVLNFSSAAATVVLWQRVAGQGTYGPIAKTSTDASGGYAFRRGAQAVRRNTDWYVTADGTTSATDAQGVRAVVTLSVRRSVPRGSRITLRGRVAPDHAGERVEIELRMGRRWTVVARPQLDGRSRYSIVMVPSGADRVRLRAVLPGDVTNVWSSSRTVTVTASG
jgi:hypothetical protein